MIQNLLCLLGKRWPDLWDKSIKWIETRLNTIEKQKSVIGIKSFFVLLCIKHEWFYFYTYFIDNMFHK